MNSLKKTSDDFFLEKDRIKIIDSFRITYFLTFMLVFALTELGRYVYRPFIYENGINDWGIADTMGNLGGVIVQIFFGLTLFNSSRKKGIHLILFFVVGYILYEFLQIVLPKGVFDWKDVHGTLIGGFLGFLTFLIIHRAIRINRIFFRF